MDDSLTIATSTDSEVTAQAVANGLPARIEEPEPVKEPKYEAPPNTRVDSYESPLSERNQLLARLQAAEADLEAAESETIVVNDAAQAEEMLQKAPAVDESLLPVDMDAVRRQATQDAIAEGQRRAGLNQSQFANQHDVEIAKLSGQFQAKLQAIAPPNFGQLVQNAHRQGVDITPAIRDALLVSPEGPQVLVRLLEHPEELRELAAVGDQHVASYAIGRMAGALSAPRQRSISNAPPPIRPLSGSDTRSALPMDQLSYADYKRAREHQIKNRYRGR
jgi:hypothetical protein